MDATFKVEDFDRADAAAAATHDAAAEQNQDDVLAEADNKSKVTREKSQIAFPWYDLDTAISVARIIHDAGGIGISRDQLGGLLGISPTAGNFSIKTGAARMYGLIEIVQSKFQLTQLGHSILSKDEVTEKAAKVEAFLNVPLYRRAYDEFKGKQLPPRPTGLENAFGQFGVTAKSRAVARQVFDRSARQSGFSTVDPDRLIEPVLVSSGVGDRKQVDPPIDQPSSSTQNNENGSSNQRGQSLELDELVRGLLRRLPKEGQKWTPEAKAKWLRALSQNLDYVCEVEGDKVVVIEVRPESGA